MATAKKLPSGSWRAQVYSHSITITEKDGKSKKKRIYESFTSDDPGSSGKREAEYMAADFAMNKKKRAKPQNHTLRESIDLYIENSDAVLSPTTIKGYKTIKKNSFPELMDISLKTMTTEMLQSAVNKEAKRKPKNKKGDRISPKSVSNNYGLITAVLSRYCPSLDTSVKLPAREHQIKELLDPELIFKIVKGTEIELPVLLSMWLSFSMSEIRGLKKSTSILDGYITIKEVVVDVDGEAVRKKQAKTFTRTRKHKIPEYIQLLIDKTNPNVDELVALSGSAIYNRFMRLLEKNELPHMTFHDLRHVNASVMALLKVPDKYALERGGWKTDNVMKKVYTHTFSDPRKEVDTMINNYFNSKVQHEMQHK